MATIKEKDPEDIIMESAICIDGDPIIKKGKVGIQSTGITMLHFCAC
jgi:hypothetical protein